LKKVIIVAPNYYTSVFQVGSHHYARAFEKMGYQVAYISAPISPLHKLFSNSEVLAEREHIHSAGGFWEGSIWYYVPKAFITPQNKPLLSSKSILNHWHKTAKISLTEILKQNGFEKVDILWFDSPLFSFLMDKISHTKSILRLADYSKGLGASDMHYDAEVSLGQNTDTIVFTAKSIAKQYPKLKNYNMLYIPNGIDSEHFITCNKELPIEYKSIPSPRAIYVGAIEEWFDIDLVYKSAVANPEFSFVLIGKSGINLVALEKLKNVFILGTRPYNTVCNYLYFSDIGMIPFKKNEFTHTINPLKVYEYLASGLNVVSVNLAELICMKEFCNLAEDDHQFIEMISHTKQIDSQKIDTFLSENDWLEKLKIILDKTL